MLTKFNGLNIYHTETVGDPYTDWSDCRSPSRAKRRARRGHKQRSVVRYRPNGKCIQTDKGLFMHPIDAIELEKQMREKYDYESVY